MSSIYSEKCPVMAAVVGGLAGNSTGVGMHLTARENAVLALIAHGSSDRDISGALRVTLGTARKHRENIQQKLNAGKAALLVWHYLRLHPGELKKSR
ncbi:hypothetical protein GJ699_14400 [Duganella sp. FT80W]|uniref:HTH luxR-type domain-containing protein n=1 Tax=Duganella guangzhouensis TaxID=2666084 RepID=A0A6I2KZW8_9BURK|nr:LuxR C-terminal-related transcriptional regulator [Duganella guangzhouensis]MRW91183.1 hypothetical protein [Duganella guangzhouensis]